MKFLILLVLATAASAAPVNSRQQPTNAHVGGDTSADIAAGASAHGWTYGKTSADFSGHYESEVAGGAGVDGFGAADGASKGGANWPVYQPERHHASAPVGHDAQGNDASAPVTDADSPAYDANNAAVPAYSTSDAPAASPSVDSFALPGGAAGAAPLEDTYAAPAYPVAAGGDSSGAPLGSTNAQRFDPSTGAYRAPPAADVYYADAQPSYAPYARPADQSDNSSPEESPAPSPSAQPDWVALEGPPYASDGAATDVPPSRATDVAPGYAADAPPTYAGDAPPRYATGTSYATHIPHHHHRISRPFSVDSSPTAPLAEPPLYTMAVPHGLGMMPAVTQPNAPEATPVYEQEAPTYEENPAPVASPAYGGEHPGQGKIPAGPGAYRHDDAQPLHRRLPPFDTVLDSILHAV